MDEGYILLYRKMLNWEWMSDANTLAVFIYCLLRANWRDGKFQGTEVHRGEFVTSIASLAGELGLSVQNIRTALRHLESTGEITSKSHAKYRIIAISHYDDYQCPNKEANNQLTSIQQATNKQLTTIEESNKEIRKEYISISSSKDSDIDRQTETVRQGISEDVKKVVEAWNSLTEYGISGVSKMTSTSTRYKNLTARLKQYSLEEVLKAIEIIKDSDFLLGRKTDWRIDFDWFVKPNNFPKVLDGNYLNNKREEQTKDWSWLDK